MRVKELRNWLVDKSRGTGRRQSLASEDNLAQVEQRSEDSDPWDAMNDAIRLAEESATDYTRESSMDNNAREEEESAIGATRSEEEESVVNTSRPFDEPATHRLESFQILKQVNESTINLEQNPSTDPTVATRDDSPSTVPSGAESWGIPQERDESWEKSTCPDPVLDYSLSSSFEGSLVSTENLGDFFSRKPASDDAISVSTEVMTPRKMHNANIFGNRMMTARALDSICNDGKIIQRAYSTPNFHITDDDATTSSMSHDSPSITPGVLDLQMTRVLLDPYPANDEVQLPRSFNLGHPSTPLRKKIDPKDLAFLKPKERSPALSPKNPTREKESAVSKGIEKFGGTKKSLVQLRKEQLQKIWDDDKEVVRVKKIEWGFCQKTRNYKKKITFQVEK